MSDVSMLYILFFSTRGLQIALYVDSVTPVYCDPSNVVVAKVLHMIQ